MTSVVVYGPTEPSSFSVVADGLAKGLRQNGLSVTRASTAEPPPPADVALVVSTELDHVRLARLTSPKVALLVAPNSLGLHPVWQEELLHGLDGGPLVDLVVTPSEWACEVLRKCLPGLQIVVAPHGAEPPVMADPKQHANEVWHVVTTPRRRKGTEELLAAWSMLKDKIDHRFTLVIRGNHRFLSTFEQWWEEAGSPPRVRIEPAQMLDHEESMREMARRAYAVVAPSRCEAFGLVPAEAAMMGIPVVATLATGHREWMGRLYGVSRGGGIMPIRSRSVGDSDDYPGATAPVVLAEDIGRSMRSLLREPWVIGSRRYLARANALDILDKHCVEYGSTNCLGGPLGWGLGARILANALE